MSDVRAPGLLLGLVLLVCLIQPAAAFGAGNIASVSKVEGQNCTSTACIPLRMAHLAHTLQGATVTSRMRY